MMSREKDMLLELERQCRILVYGKISKEEKQMMKRMLQSTLEEIVYARNVDQTRRESNKRKNSR